jgi:predicted GNAT family acetyltransferase
MQRGDANVQVVRFSSAAAFLERARPWLMRAEVENNVIDSIATQIAEGALVPKEAPYIAAAIAQTDEVVACALRTPPHKLLITDGPDDALHALARDVFAVSPNLPAISGPEPAAGRFVAEWAKLAGCTVRFGTHLRLYQTRVVAQDLPRVPGFLRHAGLQERPLAIAWANAFGAEAIPNERFDQEDAIDRAYRKNALYFWDDSGPVSMVSARGKTARVARVGAVYTPRELRRRGYATAAVAELTRRLLAEGIESCCLYTDLANPISNSIYQQIGYRPVVDFNDYLFGE